MPNPRQLALQIQINERASLKNFFVSKNNNKTIQTLKDILLNSNNGAQIFIDDLGSNGKVTCFRQFAMIFLILIIHQFISLCTKQ